ncbi:MAG: YesL family protein [Eubacteriales bacterium]|nr:YesL family protein [Eubacteriales bacterium]
MFGKFMNGYFYGKSGKGDYTHEDLPGTRTQLFWETLRTRFSGLMRLNLLYMLSWLPALLVIGFHVLMFYSATVNLADMQAQLDAGTLAAAEFATQQALYVDAIKSIAFQGLLFLIPALAITGPFTAGISLVTRNWARDEHAFLWGDYKDAVKENWKQGLITSVITGFVPVIVYVCWSFYGQMAQSNTLYIIPQVLTLLLGIVWLMSLMYTYPLIVTYHLRYRDVLRNSLLLTIGRLPITVGLKLLSIVPVLIAAVVSYLTPYFQWALMICILYYVLLGFSLSRFVAASYTNAVFDKYINVKIEGAQLNRGLYVETDEDEEDGQDGSNPQP